MVDATGTPQVGSSRLGFVVDAPRRLLWRLLRPYLIDVVREQELRDIERRLNSETATVRRTLLATNHRITWLESQIEGKE